MAESSRACHVASMPLGESTLPRGDASLPRGDEDQEEELGGVVGAAAAPVVIARAGFQSGHVALATEQKKFLELLEKLTKELTNSSLISQTVDISVDDLIMPSIDKLLADTISDLWPPRSLDSVLPSGQPETVIGNLEIKTFAVPSSVPANLTTATSQNLPSVTSDAALPISSSSPSHSAFDLSFSSQVDNVDSISMPAPGIPLQHPPFSSDCSMAVDSSPPLPVNGIGNGNGNGNKEMDMEMVLPVFGPVGDLPDFIEILEVDSNLPLEAMAAVLTAELPEASQEAAVNAVANEKLTAGGTENWTCWPPGDPNCGLSVPVFENGYENGHENENDNRNGSGNGDRNGNGNVDGDAGILIEELMKEFGEELGEAQNSGPMKEPKGQPLWNGALDNFEDVIGTETGVSGNCQIPGSPEGRKGSASGVESLGDPIDHGVILNVVDKVNSEICKEGEGTISVTETAKTKSKKGRKRDVVKEEEAKKQAKDRFLDEGERTRRVNAVLAIAKERELARENSTLYCIRDLKEASKLSIRGRRRRCDMDAASRLLDASVRSNANHVTSQHKTKGCQSEENVRAMDPNELLIVVEFMDPDRRDTKSQEFIVCASQPLTSLRDAVYCLHDVIAMDANLSLPSAYICIEDVFYNDMRDRDAKDYSASILDWNRSQRKKWKEEHMVEGIFDEGCPSELFSAKMEETTFLDLNIQIGMKYVYLHQGGCKHVFQITDARFVHPTDVQNKIAYPVTKFIQKFRHRKCMACGILAAKKVVYGDELMPESPSFLCQDCYYSAHYSNDGKLLYSNYSVFDYYHE